MSRSTVYAFSGVGERGSFGETLVIVTSTNVGNKVLR